MRQVILDTNVLLSHWHRSRKGPRPLGGRTRAEAESWARRLIELQRSDAIVTPVYLEMVGGTVSGHELELTKAYLGLFRIVDRGEITAEDWVEARRLAERIPPGPEPRRRGLVDCLIKAIANRLRFDVRTADAGMPR